MATRKQRRRREKGRRHEYEYVYVDDTGQEVEVDEPEPKPKEKPVTSGQKPTGQKAKAAGAKSGTAREERKIDPPSWAKVGRRGLIFSPFILVFMYLIRAPGDSMLAVLLRAVLFAGAVIPLMYVVDSLTYRWYQKRQAGQAGGSPPKSK